MGIELAVALAALAARMMVTGLLRSGRVDSDDWAAFGGQVVETLIATSSRQSSAIQYQLVQLNARLDAAPAREFDQHMAAGRRHLRDLPVAWRTVKDRRKLIRDARAEFVRAYATAELMADANRQALADVAIAGCWLWVPSPNDVKNTVGHARQLLEGKVLGGHHGLTASYRDVLEFCKASGEQKANTGIPILPYGNNAPAHGARVGVNTTYGAWVGCAGVEARPVDPKASADNRVRMQVRNNRTEWISICLHGRTAIARLPQNNKLPAENRVAPDSSTTVYLNPCSSNTAPASRTIGFVLPPAAKPTALSDTSWRPSLPMITLPPPTRGRTW